MCEREDVVGIAYVSMGKDEEGGLGKWDRMTIRTCMRGCAGFETNEAQRRFHCDNKDYQHRTV